MSENTNNQEEVDLGKLFILIGNFFSFLFNKIGSFFRAIFHYIIVSIIFIKKNILIIGLATILGGVIGYFISVKKPNNYTSEMILETNFGSGVELYKQVNFVDKLIKNKDYKNLSRVLQMDSVIVKSISKIEVEPYNIDPIILREYDYFIQNTDTIYTKDFTIEDFKKRYSDPDYRFQKVTVSGAEKNVFSPLNNKIIDFIENDYFKELLNLKTTEFKNRKKVLLKNLSYIDSLRRIYKTMDLLTAKKKNNEATNNINLVDKLVAKNRDIELFEKSNNILADLKKLDDDILRNGYIVKPISKFGIGKKSTKIVDKRWFKYAIFGFLLSLIGLLLLKVNKYLDNYTK